MKLIGILSLIICFSAFSQKAGMKKDTESVRLQKIYSIEGFGVLNETTNDTILNCIYDKISISKNKKIILAGKEELYGAFNSEGEEIIPIKYSSISDKGNFIMVISEEKLFGLYDHAGKIIIPLDYTFLGDVSEGKIRANKGGVAYFNNNGIFSSKSAEVGGGYWLFLDTNGKTLTQTRLTYAKDFKNGTAKVYVGGSNDDWVYGGKWTYLSSNGKLIMKDAISVSPPIEGLFVVTSNTPFGVKNVRRFLKQNDAPYVGLLDSIGNIILPSKYSEVKVISNHIIKCTYTTKNKGGDELFHTQWLNKKGEKTFTFEVEKLKKVGNVIHVLKNGTWGVYDLQGEEIIAPKYTSINNFKYIKGKREHRGFLIEQNTDGKRVYGILKENGEILIEANKDTIWGASIFYTKQGDSYSIYANGERLFEIDCDSLFLMDTRVFPQTKFQIETPTQSIICNSVGKKLFDYKGVKVIHTTEIVENGQNVFVAVKDQKQGLISMGGKVLIPFKFDRLVDWTTYENHYDVLQYHYENNLLEATYDKKKTLINRSGDILIPPIKGDFEINISSTYGWENNRITLSKIDPDDWKKDRIYGAIDTLGNVISYPKWRGIFFLPNNYYIAVPTDTYSFKICKNGQDSIIHQFESISTGREFNLQNITSSNYKDSLLFVKQNDKWFKYNTYTSTISKDYFNELKDTDFYCDMSKVTVDGSEGIIDTRGNYLIEPIYEELDRRSACIISEYHKVNGQEYAAKRNGKWGGITTKGKKLTDFIFDTPDEVWESDGDFYKD